MVDEHLHNETPSVVERMGNRKRSMPPASVHIPLLDFSKLHKPQ